MARVSYQAAPAASTWTTLFTTGVSEAGVCSSIIAHNKSTTTPVQVTVYVIPTGSPRDAKYSVAYAVTLAPLSAANGHRMSLCEGIVVPASHTVEVYATTADVVVVANASVS